MKDQYKDEVIKNSTIFWAVFFHLLTIILGFYINPFWFYLIQGLMVLICVNMVDIEKNENTHLLFYSCLFFVLGIIIKLIYNISDFIDGASLKKHSNKNVIDYLEAKAGEYAGKGKEKESDLILEVKDLLEN